MNDFDPFERRLAAALRSDADRGVARFDPATIAGAAIARAAIASAQRRALRVPWGFSKPMLTRLAAAAVIGVLAVGGAFFVGHRGQPAVVSGPSPTPGVSASPSETASPSAGPSPVVVPFRAPSWTATGSMVTARTVHTAVLLANGRVLVFGGFDNLDHTPPNNGLAASTELYDPASGTWTPTGKMVTPRFAFAATLLRDGRVLVAGGSDPASGKPLTSAELYDPGTGKWSATGSPRRVRDFGTATLLLDGRVLVVGSDTSAELYDPATGTWTVTANMITPAAQYFTATLLPDGKVLVADGRPAGAAELYDPVSGTWKVTGSMGTPREGHTATLLSDGKVLVAGGRVPGGFGDGPVLASAELYDPTTGAWTATGSMGTPRIIQTATLLPDGRVLVLVAGDATAPAELYDPASGTWTTTTGMGSPHASYTATLLPDGRVLVAGGLGAGNGHIVASAELYDPGSPPPAPGSPGWSPTPSPLPSPSAGGPTPGVALIAFMRLLDNPALGAWGGSRLWIVGADGSGAHELFPNDPGAKGNPAWTPDGSRLIFTDASRLYLTDASGSKPQLVDTGCAACFDTDAAFSPDGTQLVFVRTRKEDTQGGGQVWHTVIATMDLASGRVVELRSTAATGNERPRWSPDGKQIVFSRTSYGYAKILKAAVFVVDSDGQHLRQISPAALAARLPDWSPDGSRIVFATLDMRIVGGWMRTSDDIYAIHPDGTGLRRLTTNGISNGATWMPDGRILFTRVKGGAGGRAASGFWTMSADGSHAVQIVPGKTIADDNYYESGGGRDAAWQPAP
jgi:Tol biopolymer transport system component